ncbi:uncharacterized protein LOC122753667 [Dromiciops gliroides]|uniref:uncharacterized protein LOC122753667 n=1 Tax=Dromiciops gliroides TaxID=33562 RepID=UPI001CC7B25B|nr:uncharacterized protein LOC122753667 [Dromiciops gliroides]
MEKTCEKRAPVSSTVPKRPLPRSFLLISSLHCTKPAFDDIAQAAGEANRFPQTKERRQALHLRMHPTRAGGERRVRPRGGGRGLGGRRRRERRHGPAVMLAVGARRCPRPSLTGGCLPFTPHNMPALSRAHARCPRHARPLQLPAGASGLRAAFLERRRSKEGGAREVRSGRCSFPRSSTSQDRPLSLPFGRLANPRPREMTRTSPVSIPLPAFYR